MRQLTVREARDKRGWTQERLAEESGVLQGTISKLESGAATNPTNSTVEKLERALKLKRGTLVFGQVMARSA